MSKQWNELIEIPYPILQAPMAGVTNPLLVATVSNHKCLGQIGAGYLTTEQTLAFIREVKALTSKPFGINLFVPENNSINQEKAQKMNHILDSYRDDLHIPKQEISLSSKTEFEQQIEVVLQEKVNVCSFTFGTPSKEIIQELKKNGTVVVGTATTVREGEVIQDLEMDAVVVQGSEAGGHRGAFLNENQMIGLMSLIPQVTDAVKIPVIAAGGIMDSRGIAAALCLGAQAAQLGTAFLTTEESGAHELHKKAILHASEEDTVLTKVFSGKTARGLNNRFIEEISQSLEQLPAYPYQNELTKDIRKAAGVQNKTEYMSLWSGQSPRLSRNISVEELISSMITNLEGIYFNR